MTWTIPDDSVYEPEKVRPSNSSSSGSLGSDFLNFCPQPHFYPCTGHFEGYHNATADRPVPFFIVLAVEDYPAAMLPKWPGAQL